MKKIISMIIIAASLVIIPSLTVNAAINENDGIISLLKELEIMQGDENGDMMLDRRVSRAEFAKIAIAASPEKNSVAIGLKQSPFKDVLYTQWYAPYVKAAVSAGYVQGYLDATYRPLNTVTYEEAATILIRVLGYDDRTFSEAYPYGQLSKAQSLDLLDDVNAGIGDELTRYQVMRMIYNAIGTYMASGVPLCTAHDCVIMDDVDVIATGDQDDTLGTDKVFTSAGTYTKGDFFDVGSAGMTGSIYVKNKKNLVAFVPDKSYSDERYEVYFVYSVLSNASIVGYKNGRFEEIDIPDGTTVYKNQQPATYATIKNTLKMGDTLYIKRTANGSVDYVTYDSNNLDGPVKATGDGWITELGVSSSSKVFRSGVESSASAVQTNDIVYYSAPLDVVFAYTDKVTGIYEKAAPTKDTPETVTISGKEYRVESVEAFEELSSGGNYKYGDTVTILLGRTGEVAGIAGESVSKVSSSASFSGSAAGYVIEAGRKDFTNPDNTVYSSYYITVVSPDGTIGEYPTTSNYSSSVCSAVSISLKNGKASISRRTSSSGLSGKVNASKGLIGDTAIADDVRILDTLGTDSDDIPAYCKVYPQRIDGVNLTSSNVLYYSKNSSGEVDELILRDVTGDTYTYGIVTKRDKTTGAYTIDIDGVQNTYMTGFSSSATGPYRFKLANGRFKSMQQLSPYQGYISELTRTEAIIDSKKYLLSDQVVVYTRNISSAYMKIPLDDVINGNYRLTAYYDKAQSSGGRIRIIIAQDK